MFKSKPNLLLTKPNQIFKTKMNQNEKTEIPKNQFFFSPTLTHRDILAIQQPILKATKEEKEIHFC